MNLFVRGSVALLATVFASLLIFNAQPLSAITNTSQQPAQEQQEKKDHAGTNKSDTTVAENSGTTSAELTGTVSAVPATDAVTSNENHAAPLTAPQAYVATSYSLRGRGASGLGVRKGTIAADPKVLPYGTRVWLDAGPYTGEYLVTDCGTAIKGRKIDVWVPTYREACRFGRKNVKLTVLSYGQRKAKGKR